MAASEDESVNGIRSTEVMLATENGARETRASARPIKHTWATHALYPVWMLLILWDLWSDCYLAYQYWAACEAYYFAATVIFIVVPGFLISATGFVWYWNDAGNPNLPKPSVLCWFVRGFFLVTNLGPFLRYFETMRLGYLFMRQQKTCGCKLTEEDVKKAVDSGDCKCVFYYKLMLKEQTDASFLQLFEACLETGPQLVLQGCIFFMDYFDGATRSYTTFQMVKMAATLPSFVGVAWALGAYNRTVRFSLPEKANAGWKHVIMTTVARLLLIFSRCFVLAIFSALLHFWALVPVLAHTLLMGAWILTMKTEVCLHYYQELVFAFMLSVSYYFVFINPEDKPTKAKYTFHYATCFFEDLLLMAFWLMRASNDPRVTFWFKLSSVLFVLHALLLSALVLTLYYSVFHPGKYVRRVGKMFTFKKRERRPTNGHHASETAC